MAARKSQPASVQTAVTSVTHASFGPLAVKSYPLHEPRLPTDVIVGHAREHDEYGYVGGSGRGVARERADVGGLLLRQGLHGGRATALVVEAQARTGL